MSRERTLERVERDVASGDLGKARDRLLGLLMTFPHDLELRRRLGEIYLELRHPESAGRWLWLVPDPSDAERRAVQRFEAGCGNRAARILYRLKLRELPDAEREPHQRARVEELLRRASVEEGRELTLGHKPPPPPTPSRLSQNIVGYGCMTLLALIGVFAMIGAISVLRMLFPF